MKRFNKIGPGTIALLLACIAVVWGIDFGGGAGVGIYIMRLAGLRWLYSITINSVYWFSFLFTIPSYIVGRKYNDNFGAIAGRRIACVYAGIILVFNIISAAYLFFNWNKII